MRNRVRAKRSIALIYWNEFKRDALTKKKLYQNSCQIVNLLKLLDPSWSDEVVNMLKVLMIAIGPYVTVRGQTKANGEQNTALSSCITTTLTGASGT